MDARVVEELNQQSTVAAPKTSEGVKGNFAA